MNQLQQVLQILQIAAGIFTQATTGDAKQYIALADDLLQVANSVLAAHAAITGIPIDDVISKLHELPLPEQPK